MQRNPAISQRCASGLESGGDPNETDNSSSTLLMWVARGRHITDAKIDVARLVYHTAQTSIVLLWTGITPHTFVPFSQRTAVAAA